MAKAFKITDNLGNSWEGRKTDWTEARAIAFQAAQEPHIEYTFEVYGKEVTIEEFNETINSIEDEKFNKKLETHKQVYIQDGVAVAATKKYRKVWVRR